MRGSSLLLQRGTRQATIGAALLRTNGRNSTPSLLNDIGSSPTTLPLNKLTGVEEELDAFVVTAIIAADTDEITTATAIWRKEPFESWWAAARRRF
jgi:hypothetical protein